MMGMRENPVLKDYSYSLLEILILSLLVPTETGARDRHEPEHTQNQVAPIGGLKDPAC